MRYQRIHHSGLILFLGALILVSGWAWAQTFGASDAVEKVGPGSINWTAGEVYATGIGAPPSHAVNAAQMRAMTERAAFVVALRNLLETVKGVRVDSETLVENFMVTSDVVRTRVEGVVRGARIVKKRYLSDGSVEVVVVMPLQGAFLDAVLPEDFGSVEIRPLPARPMPTPKGTPDRPVKPLPEPKVPEPSRVEPARPAPSMPEPSRIEPVPPAPAPLPPAGPTTDFSGGKATGLVIDGTGLGLRPALMPRIVDHRGDEIYVGRVVTRTNAAEQGVAGYARDVNAAAGNFRVTDNPVVMKGARAVGTARTDIMLGQADAANLRALAQRSDFLQYCRVIIVY